MSSMNKRMNIVPIACTPVWLGLMFISVGCTQHVEKNAALSRQPKAQPEITQHFHRMLRYHARMDGNVPDGAVIFIGDSIMQGLCVSAVATPSVNYGIGSDTTVGVLKRLPVYKSIRRARAVVIAIGINDMRFRSNEDILHNYSAITERIPRNVPVIFSAVLPIDEEARDEWQGRRQARIQSLNADLQRLTQRSERLFFVDAGPLLVDAQGNLADEFHDGDGVHLNAQGNAIWIQQLQKALATVRQSAACGKE